ncbi:hypothetical protein GJ744_002675 [Endocarpon pusillum]|uniref:Major facilitator superfamily (MFS) profile domain-containing protein n=1 Tax=Endocarpon pusillum TaxID=364733 RepID=A0A8H7ABL2_9EURO|nr:hypothetical protein GJ744_002675 [Endocarpon pusillum]
MTVCSASMMRPFVVANSDIPNINQEARNAIILSTAIVMEGYDLSVMNGVSMRLLPSRTSTETNLIQRKVVCWYQLNESAMVFRYVRLLLLLKLVITLGFPQVGSIIGLYLNVIISEAIGYKKTIFGSLVLMIAFIFIPFFAQNLPTLLAGGILEGMPHATNADEQASMMEATTELEKAMSKKSASQLQCFRGIDARRTEIASVAWVIQAFCGSAFMGYSTQFYKRAGPTKDILQHVLGQYAMGAVGTMGSWWLMPLGGRRTRYVVGLGIMTGLLLIIGFGDIAPESNVSASWAIGSMFLGHTFVYDTTVGPVCYSHVSEILSIRVQIKTVVLARNFYNMASIINNALTPEMIGVNAWNWGAKTGIFWAGLCALLFTWS